MRTIKKSYAIRAPLEKVWEAFVDPEVIDEWGAGPAVMDEQAGTKFSLWGGDIHGKNLEVAPQEKIIQEWFGGDWEEPSIVSFSFSTDGDKTHVDLIQENVPEAEADDIDDGWDSYYLGAIKEYLET